jgi:hypothetical protein
MPEHTIAENLTRLQNAKTAIGNAIAAKGGTVATGDGLEEFAADIATITNQYSSSDEGKVVSGGALIAQTAYPTTITENGTYNTTNYNSIAINVPSSNSNIIMCDYSSAFDDNYIKYPSYLMIDEERKNIIFFMFFFHTNSSTRIPTADITLTPQIPLSTIFDGKNLQKVAATYVTRSSSGVGNWAYGTSVSPFQFNTSQNKILCNVTTVYGGLLGYECLSYE